MSEVTTTSVSVMVESRLRVTPPELPPPFNRLFTNGKDASFVGDMYAAVWEAEQQATALSYKGCSWNEAQVEVFARALPSFASLEALDLSGTALGDAGDRQFGLA